MLSKIYNADIVFIFEGITGCGKSTQISDIVEHLRTDYSINVYSSSAVYSVIDSLRPLQNQNIESILQESIFFQFMNWMMFQKKEHSDIAFVDRFLMSNFVYTLNRLQFSNQKYDLNKVRDFIIYPCGTDPLKDTLTIYIDCPADIAYKRTSKRNRNIFNFDVQKNVREKYIKEFERYPHYVKTINGSLDQISVSQAILEFISPFLH